MHRKELSLFCTQPQCNKPICQICLLKDHAGHVDSVVDIAEDLNEKQKWLMAKVNELVKDLPVAKLELAKIKEEADKTNKRCIAMLESQKKETNAIFDAMIKKVCAHNQTMKRKIGLNISWISNFLFHLKYFQGTKTVTYQETLQRISMVNYIEHMAQKVSCTGKSDGAHFECSNFSDFGKTFGNPTKRKTCVYSDEGGNQGDGNNLNAHDEADVERPRVKRIQTEMPIPSPPQDTWKSNSRLIYMSLFRRVNAWTINTTRQTK